MDEFHRAAAGLIQICRDAVNDVVYGGEAPHDSNALSEHWPTREGAAFTGEYRGQKFMVVVLPPAQRPAAGSLGWPDYGVLDDASG